MASDVKLVSNLASCIKYFHVNYPCDDQTTSMKQRGQGRLLKVHDVRELSQSQETEVLTRHLTRPPSGKHSSRSITASCSIMVRAGT